jgi:fused signal recognition particle receptor
MSIFNFFKKKPKADDLDLRSVLLKADFGTLLTKSLCENNNSFSKAKAKIQSLMPKSSGLIHKGAIVLTGINGVGKTTSIAKLASMLKDKGYSVAIGAGDTFRAAAKEQITHFANKLNIPIIDKSNTPSAVAFDLLQYQKQHNIDYVILDTAGRLHSQDNLLKELSKVYKVMQKFAVKIQTLQVLDSCLGQSNLIQVETFNKFLPIDGLIITKLDTGSKGGSCLAVSINTKTPIEFLCSGETIYSINSFDLNSFLASINSKFG